MKKEATRDYATEAFRLYASLGKPSWKNLKDGDLDISVITNEALMLDIRAVKNTLDILLLENKINIITAIDEIYFYNPTNYLRKNDIMNRVINLAVNMPASERSIFYWLKEARVLFAKNRGLRIK